jgi:hypothetical protein
MRCDTKAEGPWASRCKQIACNSDVCSHFGAHIGKGVAAGLKLPERVFGWLQILVAMFVLVGVGILVGIPYALTAKQKESRSGGGRGWISLVSSSKAKAES